MAMSLNNHLIKMPNGLLGVSAGIYPDIKGVHCFGINPGIANGSVPESIWTVGGVYPWDQFGTGEILTLASTANDTGYVTIEGLDANYDLLVETVTLTGTTPVLTSNEFMRVNRAYYVNGDYNDGDISIEIDSIPVAMIDAGKGHTLSTNYTVPAGHTAFLVAGDTSVNKGHDAQVEFYVRMFGGSFMIQHVAEVYENSYKFDFFIPFRVPEKSDIDVRVSTVENSGTRVTATYDMVLDKCLNY